MTLSGIQAVSAATLRRLELGAGDLSTACLAAMEERLPWFRRLPADQRAGVLLVTQTGAGNFVAWLTEPDESIRLTAEAFRIAPRDLAQRLSLRQTVDLVRVATDVFEERLPRLAADAEEYHVLVEAVLRFGREIAFAAATVYAAAAETRGAWDARQEALIVDGVVRGDAADALVSRAAALGWDPTAPLRVLVGAAPEEAGAGASGLGVRDGGVSGSPRDRGKSRATREISQPGARDPGRPGSAGEPSRPGGAREIGRGAEILSGLRRHAARLGRSVLVSVQGSRLVVLLTEPRPRADAAETVRTQADDLSPIVADFGPGAVVVGPPAPDLAHAHASAREALAGLRAAPGWPDAPRPVHADDLLPERAVSGDSSALHRLVEDVVVPVEAAGGELMRTLATYLEGGGALEACARALYVHPNTVRYRLRRVSELTGRSAFDPRDALVLRMALVAGRLAASAAPAPPAGSGP